MENVILTYKSKSPETDALLTRIGGLVDKYKRTGINKENLCTLVSVLMMEVHKFKRISGPEKKEMVLDIIYTLIENIEEGEHDTELETLLKAMVPTMIDSFSVMLKVNKGCGCMK